MSTQRQTGPLRIAGGLLVLAVAALGVLWLQEQRRRSRAEQAVEQLQRELLRSRGRERLAGVLGPGSAPVRREALTTQAVRLDGRARTALRLPAALAERLGFCAGDLIVVEAPAATRPSPPGGR